MLHRRGVEVAADPGEQSLALGAIVVENTDLDQLVRQQIDVDFVQHGWREAVVADADERMEGMRLRTEGAALRGC